MECNSKVEIKNHLILKTSNSQHADTKKELGLGWNLITGLGAKHLAEALKINQTLNGINFEGNPIGDTGAKFLSEALESNQNLIGINLYYTQMTDIGAESIAEALKLNKKLQRIDIGANIINDTGANFIAEMLKINNTLIKLDLDSNGITELGTEAISESLKINSTLKKLNLMNNDIESFGADYLCQMLKVNKTLQVLHLDENKIDDNGVKSLSEVLKENSSLIELGIAKNLITDVGAIYLSESLKFNKNLTNLNLAGNLISNRGVNYLSESLKINEVLLKLNLSSNRISAKGGKYLGDCLKLNKTLFELNIFNNRLSDLGIKYLAESLKENYSLTNLSLVATKITDIGANYLIEVMINNNTLKVIHVGWNEITMEVLKELKSSLRRNKIKIKIKSLKNSKLEKLDDIEIKEEIKLEEGLQELIEVNDKIDMNSITNGVIMPREESFKIEIDELTFKMDPSSPDTRLIIKRDGLGDVFHAEYKDKEVSVIEINCEQDEIVRIIKKKIESMSHLKHPNLNQFILFSQDEKKKTIYIITEYIRMRDLCDILKKENSEKIQKMSIKRRVEILIRVSSAVNYLHTFKPVFLHRDIRSENIFLSEDFNVLVSGFGFYNRSKFYVKKHKRDATPCLWMAPEILNGINRHYEASSDVYSFGILMWEVFSGKVPFQEKGKNEQTIINSIREGSRPLLKDLDHKTPPEAISLMKRCWDQTPANRPLMIEVLDSLRTIFDKI